MINRLTNLRPSVLSDKWRFDTSRDWEVLEDNFDSVSSETIPDATLRALGFHYSPLGYHKEGGPRFVDISDKLELEIEEPEDNIQPITDSENKKARKGSEHAAMRKARRDNLGAPVWKALATGSATLSSPRPPMPALSSRSPISGLSSRPPAPGSLSCLPLPSLSSRLLMPGLSSSPPVPGLLSLPIPASLSPPVPAPLSPPVPALSSRSMLGPAPTCLTSSTLRTFKRALSDELLGRRSTSPCSSRPLCPFLTLGLLSKKSDRRRPFDTALINSRPLTGNHTAKEVDLSFGECGCLALVKLNRL